MKTRLLFLLLIAFIGLLVMAVLAFPQIVLAVVLPFATAAWLLLRFFVLSIDQEVWWWGLISLAMIVMLGRLVLRSRTHTQLSFDPFSGSHLSRDRADYWRSAILLNVHSAGEWDTFRRDLMWLFTSMHSSKRQRNENYKIREAILKHEIPIPESIYAFFFSPRPPAPEGYFLKHPIASLQYFIRSRRRAGGRKSDYFLSIDEVLSYLETSLEMKSNE